MKHPPHPGVRIIVVAGLLCAALITPAPAGATSVSSLRARAQAVADEVTALERRLEDLHIRERELGDALTRASARIGALELELHDLDAAYARAEETYVRRAVDAYQGNRAASGPTLLLSASNFTQLLTLAHVSRSAAEADADALAGLTRARAAAENAQDRIDGHKQELMVLQNRTAAVAHGVALTVDRRRATLARLTRRIAAMERASLAAGHAQEQSSSASGPAAASRGTEGSSGFTSAPTTGTGVQVDPELLRRLAPSGPASHIPEGLSRSGVSFEGIASWYGPGFEGNHTASGDVFDSSLYTAASKDLPFGTWLYVTYQGKSVVVLVNDRGPYVGDRVLDLSRAAAQAIGISGLGWIKAEILTRA